MPCVQLIYRHGAIIPHFFSDKQKSNFQQFQFIPLYTSIYFDTAKYFTPKGNDIHKVGITPDVEVKLDASLLNRTDYTHDEDNQLQAAIEAVSR